MNWTKHTDDAGTFYTMPTEDENFYIKVERSQAGDYFVCVVEEDAPAGGEVEYCNTLSQAKKIGEAWLTTGEWINWKDEA